MRHKKHAQLNFNQTIPGLDAFTPGQRPRTARTTM